MSMYFKALGIHVYLATIRDTYFRNGKYLEANAKAIYVLKSTINDEYLSRVSNIDSTFIVWNTRITPGEQMTCDKESDSDERSTTSNMCYMVQGDDPLEINFESQLEEDIDMSHVELASFCQKVLEKYDLLKIENDKLKKKNTSLLKENDSFKNKFECVSNENELLKRRIFSCLQN